MGEVDFLRIFFHLICVGSCVLFTYTLVSAGITITVVKQDVFFGPDRISQRDGPSLKVHLIRCYPLSTMTPAPYRCYAPSVSFTDDIWVTDIHVRCDSYTKGVNAENCTVSYSTVAKNDEYAWKYSTMLANAPGWNDFGQAYLAREGGYTFSGIIFPVSVLLTFLAMLVVDLCTEPNATGARPMAPSTPAAPDFTRTTDQEAREMAKARFPKMFDDDARIHVHSLLACFVDPVWKMRGRTNREGVICAALEKRFGELEPLRCTPAPSTPQE